MFNDRKKFSITRTMLHVQADLYIRPFVAVCTDLTLLGACMHPRPTQHENSATVKKLFSQGEKGKYLERHLTPFHIHIDM